jgi:hypothetical protein
MTQHEQLMQIVKKLPGDFEPYGERSRTNDWGPDCSCGCRHFLKLDGGLGYDWGVCANEHSPRVGLLTFEHMGCEFFEECGDTQELASEPRLNSLVKSWSRCHD